MDLSTEYMGLKLDNPLVAAASPLSRQLGNVRRMEDAGLGAIVLFSLFEEELDPDGRLERYTSDHGRRSLPALEYFPDHAAYDTGPDAYLAHIEAVKQTVDIPVIASLNGTTPGGWIEYARQMEAAGADALELNIYYIPTEIDLSGQEVEDRYLDVLTTVKQTVDIPVAVKLSPYFSAMAHMAVQLDAAGCDALVLFNRFYQPDIDVESRKVFPHVMLSTPQDMRLPLRWIAILHGQIKADMAATGGIHTVEDIVKMIMAGAQVTQLAAALLKYGIDYGRELQMNLEDWLEEHDCDNLDPLRGTLSQSRCADPTAFERANYLKAFSTYMKWPPVTDADA